MEYRISQVAEQFGLEPSALRYYEQEGIVSPRRGRGGVRYYSDEDVQQLEIALCLKSTGMAIKDIRSFAQLEREGDSTVPQRLALFREHREQVKQEIGRMQAALCRIDFIITWLQSQETPHKDEAEEETKSVEM